jgi:hypothetical protein
MEIKEQLSEMYDSGVRAVNVTYKDGLTAEDVAKWKAAKKDGKAAPTPKATPAANNPVAASASFPA